MDDSWFLMQFLIHLIGEKKVENMKFHEADAIIKNFMEKTREREAALEDLTRQAQELDMGY